jgi:AAA domain
VSVVVGSTVELDCAACGHMTPHVWDGLVWRCDATGCSGFQSVAAPEDRSSRAPVVGRPHLTPVGNTGPVIPTRTYPGLTHADLLALEIPPTRQLIAGVVEAGTVGTIAGLPETWKSWLAQRIAINVAQGGPNVLGREVLQQGPVGYWWQDDSRENEAGRIKEYANRHDLTGALAIRWHLNEFLTLPDGIPVLRTEIEREQQVLVVLDSLYNFLPGVKLSDEIVPGVLAQVKAEVCDQTGCTILFVDHAPWPTEGNQGQRRGYGSVFKAATIRWGIYLDRQGDTIWVEAHGNNLTGLARTPALWNADRLQLDLIEVVPAADDLGDRIEEFLSRNPGAATSVVYAGVTGTDTEIQKLLRGDDRFVNLPPAMFGRPSNTHCWARQIDVPSLLGSTSAEPDADVAQTLAGITDATSASAPLTPFGGREGADVGRHRLRPDSQRSSSEEPSPEDRGPSSS